ncbi:gastrula zinc finger protein XlCGF8.2DB-like [Entelurus aequoreus]|uniref:gastrula zinc finger protein XlCGF8.2DB-like n=1 Tax=Entelurus aequoreus TaxID=161455 RepID=UPI002B1E1C20|nr:gastrula zinc finger protein XlCGF8.2DB-like [Entelurus aequoreus]
MCQVRTLKVLLSQQLTAAVEEIFVVLERTIAEYVEELSRTKEENERQRQLLDAFAKKPQVVLHRTDRRKEHLPPSELPKEQEEPEPPHIDDVVKQKVRTEADGEQIENLLPPLSDCDNMTSDSSDADEDSKAEATCQPDDARLTCSHCGETLRSQLLLEEHTKRHMADKSVQCTEEENLFKQEVQTEANGEQIENLLPPLSDCDGMSSNISSSDSDDEDPAADAEGPADNTPLVCAHSGKAFKSKSLLNEHMKCHKAVKTVKCTVCGKRLGQGHFARHLRLHTGEKPYECPVCGKRFARGDGMSKHMKQHAKGKPYRCAVCSAEFSNRSGLIRHKQKHKDMKLFFCSVCKTSFPDRTSLIEHTRRHVHEGL